MSTHPTDPNLGFPNPELDNVPDEAAVLPGTGAGTPNPAVPEGREDLLPTPPQTASDQGAPVGTEESPATSGG